MEWPLLASLSAKDRAQVLATARRRSFERNVVVFHEGDPADSLQLVVSGRLAVRASTPAGDSATLNILGAGDYFGELALLQTGAVAHRSATVIALEPTQTLALPATSFHALCRQNPQVERLLVTLLAARVEELSGRLLEALYVTLDRRVYRRLSELAEVYADAGGSPVAIPLTQDQIAELCGGTRPSVNQILRRLVTQGILDLGRGRIVVKDRNALRKKAGLPG